MTKLIILGKSNVMERIQIKDRLRELKELYRLSMDQYIHLSINSKIITYKKFYEERAVEKIELITDLEEKIRNECFEGEPIPLEEKIDRWSFAYGKNRSKSFKPKFNHKNLVDEDALYEIYDILNEDLSKNTGQILKRHLYLMESTLVAYGYLLRHI